jgi:Flp pilus assembly pilin Flp
MTLRIRRGQSTLEYVLILAVVVGAIVAAGVIFKPQIKKAYDTAYDNPSDTTAADDSDATGIHDPHSNIPE